MCTNPKYILITGIPGSSWSFVSKQIYFTPDVNQSDYTKERTYIHHGHDYPSHVGAYWDPGMEFEPDDWDGPFEEQEGKTKIIKSHVFAYQLNKLKGLGYPIVLIHRETTTALDWWFSSGGFDIEYPNYKPYYKDKETMTKMATEQNELIEEFILENYTNLTQCRTNEELIRCCGLHKPEEFKLVDLLTDKIKVYVYKETNE